MRGRGEISAQPGQRQDESLRGDSVQCGIRPFGADNLGSYQSGQMGQTVNLLAYAFGGSNPSLPTKKSAGWSCKISSGARLRASRRERADSDTVYFCGSSSVDRASAFQAEGREFEPRLPLQTQTRVIRMTPAGVAGTFVSPACSAK